KVDIVGATASPAELSQLISACQRFNYCIYRMARPDAGDKRFVAQTGLSLGLSRLDGNLCSDEDNISSIKASDSGRQGGYIPYTDKKLSWHTDGYYNELSRTIRAMVLHCVRPAQSGGENLLLDHEMAYIQLRDENPRFIEAFAQLDALTIPPNIEKGVEIRGAQSGAVFSFDPVSASLHMRFSARTRNIAWKNDNLTNDALACMNQLLSVNNPYISTYRMRAGEGIIANNVLHNRTAFIDAQPQEHRRLLYRARYYDRVKCSPVREK
ncbi:MAG TPA: taurine catabolism dioxygenase TauD, partial [Gammaproteobacteria bacterium]|nr:taurine catabolism dioxygenase TauD [Gammaproteobacteria bacterium]